ncbi:MAG: alpha/beta hydrolase [Solobacterium sp.]|nr:alpha/beta hydrolase [Solobacterium sp.]
MKGKLFLLSAVAGSLLYSGDRLYRFAAARDMKKITRKKKGGQSSRRELPEEWRQMREDGKEVMRSLPHEARCIISDDGLRLYGEYYRCAEPKRVVLCAHGYRGTAEGDFCDKIRFLRDAGCDLLLIHQRACGESEGDAITFGARESQDILKWLDTIETDLPVYLYGISLGATSVLLCADRTERIAGIIADCGFSSMHAILAYLGKRWMRLPAFPFLNILDGFCRVRAHFAMREADTADALRNTRIPVLFFHGTEDAFVPPENSRRSYELCGSAKKLVLTEKAGHNGSHLADPDKYEKEVLDFFAEYDSEGRNV